MRTAEHELQALEAIISAPDGASNEQRHGVDELHQALQNAMRELVDYGLKNLRVAGYGRPQPPDRDLGGAYSVPPNQRPRRKPLLSRRFGPD